MLADSSASAVGVTAALFVGLVITRVLWVLWFSPLGRQRVPGPIHAIVSSLWFEYHSPITDRTLAVHELFERYGPVVRVGPSRVLFRDHNVVKEIFRTHKFRKPAMYEIESIAGAQNHFSTSDPLLHTQLRRWSAPVFRRDNLRGAARLLHGEMIDLVATLRRDCSDGKHVNIIRLSQHVTLDMLGLAVLGLRFDQVRSGKEHKFIQYLNDWLIAKGLGFLLGDRVCGLLSHIPIPRLRQILAADQCIADIVGDLYDKASSELSPDERTNILTAYKGYRDPDTGESPPRPLLISDIGILMIAGMETTSYTMTYLVYYLARNEVLWSRLREELSEMDASLGDADVYMEGVRRLPYLNAFLREVLRVRGPGNIQIDRVTPAEGAMLGGYFVPGGTIVGGQAFSTHLDPEVFVNPHDLEPERWVRRDATTGRWIEREDVSPEMHASYIPFSQGPRGCSGRPLAELELQLVTATLASNFRVKLHESVTEASMELTQVITLKPKAGRCLVSFEYLPIRA